MTLQVVSADSVLNQVDQDEMVKFIAAFNKDMSNPVYVKNWRCGTDEKPWWRHSVKGHHSEKTEAEIRKCLLENGWSVNEVIRDTDRGPFTCYKIGQLDKD